MKWTRGVFESFDRKPASPQNAICPRGTSIFLTEINFGKGKRYLVSKALVPMSYLYVGGNVIEA